MAKDCSVKKLEGTFNNDSLPFFDAIVLKYDVASDLTGFAAGFVFSGISFNTITVEILTANAYLSNTSSGSVNYGHKKTFTSSNEVIYIKPTVQNTTVAIKVTSKYKLTCIGNPSSYYNIYQLDYAESLEYLNLSSIYNNKKNTGLENINLAGLTDCTINCYISINDLYNVAPNLVNIDCKNLSGNILELTKFYALNACFVDNSGVIGDLVELVTEYRSRPGTETGQLSLRFQINSVLFNGVAIPFDIYKLIWDATSIIAKYNSRQKAYTYGATAEQIAELEGQGFTVIEVD